MRTHTLEDRLRRELGEVQRLAAAATVRHREWFADPDVWWPARSGDSVPSANRRGGTVGDPVSATAARVAGEQRRDAVDAVQAAELLEQVAARLAS